MNPTIVTGIVSGLQAGVLCVVVGAMLGCTVTATESGSDAIRPAAPAATNSQGNAQDKEMVDCLIPGQIRRLDEAVTYPTERRLVRTTKADCLVRGGGMQAAEGAAGAPSQPVE